MFVCESRGAPSMSMLIREVVFDVTFMQVGLRPSTSAFGQGLLSG